MAAVKWAFTWARNQATLSPLLTGRTSFKHDQRNQNLPAAVRGIYPAAGAGLGQILAHKQRAAGSGAGSKAEGVPRREAPALYDQRYGGAADGAQSARHYQRGYHDAVLLRGHNQRHPVGRLQARV